MSVNKSLTELKKVVKKVSTDLSLLNGLPCKVNSEYIMNLSQIDLFNICEQFNTGAESATIDIPMQGLLTIVLDHISEDPAKPVFTYKFEPYEHFENSIREAYNTGKIELPDILLDKYSKNIVSIYDDLLED